METVQVKSDAQLDSKQQQGQEAKAGASLARAPRKRRLDTGTDINSGCATGAKKAKRDPGRFDVSRLPASVPVHVVLPDHRCYHVRGVFAGVDLVELESQMDYRPATSLFCGARIRTSCGFQGVRPHAIHSNSNSSGGF